MGIDAVAVLKIKKLPAPKPSHGVELFVQHKGDCTLVHTMARWNSMAPDEHSLTLRQQVGDALDRHRDSRGVLFFNDAYEAHGESYDEIVEEIGVEGQGSLDAGAFWTPMVAADYVPDRLAKPASGSIEELMAAAKKKMGPKGAELVQLASFTYPTKVVSGGADRTEALATYREHVALLAKAMGPTFMATLEARLEAQMEAMVLAQRAFFEKAAALTDFFAAPTPTPTLKGTGKGKAKASPATKTKSASNVVPFKPRKR